MKNTEIGYKNKKWKIVYDKVKKKIESGVYNDKTLKLKDIIEEFDISDITARRVFNELKREGLIYSLPRKGTIILTKEKIQDIYLIVRDESLIYKDALSTQIFTRIINGFGLSSLSKLFRKHIFSFNFLLSNKKDFIGKNIIIFAETILRIEKDKVEVDEKITEKIKEFHPIIIHSFGKIDDFNVVGTDYYTGFLKGVEYLFNKGHRIIGFISGDVRNVWFYPRFCGYIDGLKKFGLEIIPEIIKITSGKNPEEDEKAIEEIMKSNRRPTAILCGNDLRAINVLNWCKKNGIKVPDDLSIIGFDNIDETKFTTPQLTTIDSKLELYGDSVLKMLMKRKKGEEIGNIFIKPEIIERQTVKEV
ncbi:MAG: substrate-binding domain-containing protein [Candidatus Aenigmatarchaeota archaeon]